jgi:uncharacterized protein GlcG (DUF336 family)
MASNFVLQFGEAASSLETADDIELALGDCPALEGVVAEPSPNQGSAHARTEGLAGNPPGAIQLDAWPDTGGAVRQIPRVSMLLIRTRAMGRGSELALACEVTFSSRGGSRAPEWEVGVAPGAPRIRRRAHDLARPVPQLAGGHRRAPRERGQLAAGPTPTRSGESVGLLAGTAERPAEALKENPVVTDLLTIAKKVAERVEAESIKSKVPVAVCLIDIHGNVILHHRMTGAPAFSLDLSQRKAYTSALLRMSTADLAPLVQPGQPLFPLIMVSGGRYSAMGGGGPLISQGEVSGVSESAVGRPSRMSPSSKRP